MDNDTIKLEHRPTDTDELWEIIDEIINLYKKDQLQKITIILSLK